MIHEKVTSVGPFAKVNVDVKNGDIITVRSECKPSQGQFGIQSVFLVKLANGEEKNIAFNKTSINNMIDAYGKDDKRWVDKPAKIWLIQQNVNGSFKTVLYVSHPNATLSEKGFVLNTSFQSGDGSASNNEIPF